MTYRGKFHFLVNRTGLYTFYRANFRKYFSSDIYSQKKKKKGLNVSLAFGKVIFVINKFQLTFVSCRTSGRIRGCDRWNMTNRVIIRFVEREIINKTILKPEVIKRFYESLGRSFIRVLKLSKDFNSLLLLVLWLEVYTRKHFTLMQHSSRNC